MNETSVKKDFTNIFRILGVHGVYANLCEYKAMKTRSEKYLTLSMDPAFGPDVVKICGGDIPSSTENPIPVVLLSWEEFEGLARKVSELQSKSGE